MHSEIKKAVIPAAGLGTRFLPATKVLPKEMLPVAGRPVIQYAVEEAAASGIETVIVVIGPGKDLIPKHFSRDMNLEETLLRRGWHKTAETIRGLAESIEIKTAWQEKPLGLAHAIGAARHLLDDEPFAVILPDALIDAVVPCTRQLIDCYRENPGYVIATQLVRPNEVDRFGIVETEAGSAAGARVSRITSLLERPPQGLTNSRVGIFGRYILLPEVFSSISKTPPGRGGEFQLTDALSMSAQSTAVYAYRFDGEHFDVGSKLGFVQATVKYAMKDPALAEPLLEYLSSVGLPQPHITTESWREL